VNGAVDVPAGNHGSVDCQPGDCQPGAVDNVTGLGSAASSGGIAAVVTPAGESVDAAFASCTRPGSARAAVGIGPAAAGAAEVRPMSPAARLQGAAALLARPGSPLQPAASRGASGNLSSSSTHRSQTASPQPT
jgi:hypothetical protein